MKLRRWVRRSWNERTGRTIAAVVAVALFVFVLYQDHHRSYSTNTGGDLLPALVARETIPRGTSGAAIRHWRLYKVAELPLSQLRHGWLLSPTVFAGKEELFAKKATLRDIRPGSAITPADFGRVTR